MALDWESGPPSIAAMRISTCLLAVCGLAAADPYDVDAWRANQLGDGAVVAIYEHPLDDNFNMGTIDGTWTHADRIGGEFRVFQPPGRSMPIESWGGLLMAGDTRHGTFNHGLGNLDVDAFMIMAEGGVGAHFLPERSRGILALQASFFGRLGIGFQDGYISGYPTPFGLAQGSLAPIRYEMAVGGELQATIARRLYAVAGVGVTWFLASQAAYVSVGGSGSTVAVSATGVGSEAFGRFGLGLRF